MQSDGIGHGLSSPRLCFIKLYYYIHTMFLNRFHYQRTSDHFFYGNSLNSRQRGHRFDGDDANKVQITTTQRPDVYLIS